MSPLEMDITTLDNNKFNPLLEQEWLISVEIVYKQQKKIKQFNLNQYQFWDKIFFLPALTHTHTHTHVP